MIPTERLAEIEQMASTAEEYGRADDRWVLAVRDLLAALREAQSLNAGLIQVGKCDGEKLVALQQRVAALEKQVQEWEHFGLARVRQIEDMRGGETE